MLLVLLEGHSFIFIDFGVILNVLNSSSYLISQTPLVFKFTVLVRLQEARVTCSFSVSYLKQRFNTICTSILMQINLEIFFVVFLRSSGSTSLAISNNQLQYYVCTKTRERRKNMEVGLLDCTCGVEFFQFPSLPREISFR